jgi:hypothetical protein
MKSYIPVLKHMDFARMPVWEGAARRSLRAFFPEGKSDTSNVG